MAELWQRKELFRLEAAEACMTLALQCCERLLLLQNDTKNPIYVPLTIAMHTLYARPFSQNVGLGVLSDDLVPVQFRDIHKQHIDLRNKLYAHTDVDPSSALQTTTGELLFRVFIDKHEGTVYPGTLSIFPRTPALDSTKQLISAVHERIGAKLNESLSRLNNKLSALPDGRYEVDITSEGDVPAFKPIPYQRKPT